MRIPMSALKKYYDIYFKYYAHSVDVDTLSKARDEFEKSEETEGLVRLWYDELIGSISLMDSYDFELLVDVSRRCGVDIYDDTQEV